MVKVELLDEASEDERRMHRVGAALLAVPASWSGSISQVKSQSSFMQMAGETASERMACARSSNAFVAFDFDDLAASRAFCGGKAHVRTPEKSPH